MNESPQRGVASKVGRFAIVGLLNTAIDLIAFAGLIHMGVSSLGANVCAWAVAVSFSYVVNSRWTFERSENLPESRSFLRFVSLGALISLGVSSLFITVLTELMGLWLAKILGVVVAAVLNFIATRWSIEDRVR